MKMLEVELEGNEVEELGFELVSDGALGTVEISDSRLMVCFSGEQLSQNVLEQIKQSGCKILAERQVESNESDASFFPTKLLPVHFKELTIVPLFSDDEVRNSSPKEEIFIRAGGGFGTGHHATTKLILHYLAFLRNSFNIDDVAWDIGAGSGILSIAYQRLFGGRVVAWENDELAVTNAKINVGLNQCGENIALIEDSFPAKVGQTESPKLVMANLYSSLLLELHDSVYHHISPEGVFLVSGIMAEEYAEFAESLKESPWIVTGSSRLGDWVSFALTKPGN